MGSRTWRINHRPSHPGYNRRKWLTGLSGAGDCHHHHHRRCPRDHARCCTVRANANFTQRGSSRHCAPSSLSPCRLRRLDDLDSHSHRDLGMRLGINNNNNNRNAVISPRPSRQASLIPEALCGWADRLAGWLGLYHHHHHATSPPPAWASPIPLAHRPASVTPSALSMTSHPPSVPEIPSALLCYSYSMYIWAFHSTIVL